MKNIYLVISQTHTYFGRALRKVGKVKYNHASIALDKDLNEIYAFARPKHSAVFLGKLVKENIYRYTLGKHPYVGVTIFRIPVTEGQYRWVQDTIQNVQESEEYIYNLFSVLSKPLTGGFSTYKAFSCIEFVMYVLQELGYSLEKSTYEYNPDDLAELFPEAVVFQGNLLEYKQDRGIDPLYYSPLTRKEITKSMTIPVRLLYRLIFKHEQSFMAWMQNRWSFFN